MLGRGLSELRPQHLKMHTKWYHRFLHDMVYKWAPWGFVILLVIICTMMLSVSGKLTHAEYTGFCITAGLSVGMFITCHLVHRYCIRINNQADLEKNQGDSSTTNDKNTAQVSHNGPDRTEGGVSQEHTPKGSG